MSEDWVSRTMSKWTPAQIYVAESRPYIMGYLAEAKRSELKLKLENCTHINGETDYESQRDILRQYADELWQWKQEISKILSLD